MLSFKIAYRYLRAKKSHKAVNVIALIAVIGVALATMAMVLVLSIFNGFSDLALSQLSALDPELAIVPAKGKVIANSDSVIDVALTVNGVESAVAVVSERALLIDGDAQLPVVLKGIPSGYDTLSEVGNIIIAGQYAEELSDGTPAIQLSVGVANKVSAYPSVDTRLQLLVPRRKGNINPANPAASFRSADAVFSGVFRVNNPDVDNDVVLVPLSTARQLLDYDREATAIEIYVKPQLDIAKIRDEIQKTFGDNFKVLTRLEQRQDAFRMIAIEKWVTFMMLICILAIALFNVISTLSLMAIEKKDNMWTLRALGAPTRLIGNIFIAEGFLVTVIGGILGIIAGVILSLAQQLFHIVKLSGDVDALTIGYYPVRVEISDLLLVAGVIAAMALVISLISRLITSKTTSSNN